MQKRKKNSRNAFLIENNPNSAFIKFALLQRWGDAKTMLKTSVVNTKDKKNC